MITIPTSNGTALIEPANILGVFTVKGVANTYVRIMYPTTHVDLRVINDSEAEKTVKLIRSHLEDLNKG